MTRSLDWRWIAIGVAIMFLANLVASLLLIPLMGDSLPAEGADPEAMAAGMSDGRLALGALLTIASFVIGGFIVGWKSAGRTILEPAISAAIAVVIGLLLSGAFTIGNLLMGGLVPFLAGLLGGYLGERAQGRGTAASMSTGTTTTGTAVPPRTSTLSDQPATGTPRHPDATDPRR